MPRKKKINPINTDINREEIVKQFLPRVKYYANRYNIGLPPELSYEDLVSAGIVGLLEAAERFDPSKNVTMSTFVDFRIRGAIVDQIRAMQWASKDARKRLETVRNTYYTLEKELNRTATDEEVIDRLKISYDELYETLSIANKMSLLSLDDMGVMKDGKPVELIEIISDKNSKDILDELQLKELQTTLGRFIDELPETEKKVITLYYYEELTMKEIGNILNLSESRICQIHAKALITLKNRLIDSGIH
ncbi:MAG: FliA/WhiG family RNA polymerase sigma factor [Thermodesulfovibrionales bacterium]|nr:FliA/WhiG family RNA polymerase sigma factor [Thermodesulfovibrionales bacterium]